MFPTIKSPKISKKFICEICDYNCSKQSEYTKHISTNKHKILQNPTSENTNKTVYACDCGKSYKHSSTMYAHKKKCSVEINKSVKECAFDKPVEPCDKELIMLVVQQNAELMKKNDELQNMMMEVIKNGTHNTTNNNSHNKSFNLNFFLNETCKDAMNITDFVESIKLQLSDLEKVGEIGYVEGISNIIVKNLKGLDVTQRPVHCTDKKRETMYVKDEDKWEKDEEQKKMHTMVKKVANKNVKMLSMFKEAHPDCITSTSAYSDQYNQMVMEAMGGKGDDDFEKEEKIIKNVSKEVIVCKEAT